MTSETTLLLHTRHEPLARQICAVLDPAAQPVRTQTGDELLRVLRRQRAPVLLLDLFCEEARQGVTLWMEQVKSAVVIALGDPRTEAARQAEAAGAFAVLEPSLTGLLTLTSVIGRAAQHARLQEENRHLRAASAQPPPPARLPAPAASGNAPALAAFCPHVPQL
jgi:DNA-binding NtrC family response regulator